MNRALLVGLNNFKKISGLNGCINDAANVRDILKTYFGYENTGIHVLSNERATDDAVLDRFGNMLAASRPGDKCVFAFSSHGSHIRDRHGDELKDGEDELICCYNMDWNTGGYIIDDRIAKAIREKPDGVELEIIFDTCHSGTGTRGEIGLINCEHPTLNRYCPPPFDIAMRAEGDDLEVNKLFDCIREEDEKESEKLLVKVEYVFWGACRDIQTSADAYINGSYNGAFTYYFCKHIRDANGKISRSDLLKKVRSSLKYNRYDQVPQMETNKAHYYNNVFSNEPMPKMVC